MYYNELLNFRKNVILFLTFLPQPIIEIAMLPIVIRFEGEKNIPLKKVETWFIFNQAWIDFECLQNIHD